MKDKSCCKPDLYAWFLRERIHKVGMRHSGPFCAGRLDVIKIAQWYSKSKIVFTGEQIQLAAL